MSIMGKNLQNGGTNVPGEGRKRSARKEKGLEELAQKELIEKRLKGKTGEVQDATKKTNGTQHQTGKTTRQGKGGGLRRTPGKQCKGGK